jgi:hypothetical protein
MTYFRDLDKITYRFLINGKEEENVITNIAIKNIIKDIATTDGNAYYKYFWEDTDRPDIVADRYYGSVDFWWVVMYANNTFDVYEDFPKGRTELVRFVDEKYKDDALANGYQSGIDYARQEIKHVVDSNGNIIAKSLEEAALINNFGRQIELGNLFEVTFFEFEDAENEARREVELLDNRLLQKFVSEFQKTLSNG